MDNGQSGPVLLSVRNVRKYFPIRGGLFSSHIGDVRAVDGVSFDVHEAETVGLVGESGCGKTTVGRLVLRLIDPTSGQTYYRPPPDVAGRLDALYGQLPLDGSTDGNLTPRAQAAITELDGIAKQYSLYRMSSKKIHNLRGKLQIVFQDPFSSLSPRMLIRDIVSEPLAIHRMGTRAERYKRVAELLQSVGLNPEHLWRFPHEFSGGQRQRIGIARALALRPDFIVLDEPTSALDVSVQAQILNILKRLQTEQRLSYLFISHHLSVVRAMAQKVVVMYLGKVVERAPTEDMFNRPMHPYTQALLAAIPIPDPELKRDRIILKGDVPSPAAPPPGCRFHTRCPAVMPVCSKVEPPLIRISGDHWVACHLFPTPASGSADASVAGDTGPLASGGGPGVSMPTAAS
ncbi:MAG: ATP-binding cassette domain-containing protein [Thermoplasmata archaeon]|nr:ATP-binding cassette domain-containing protein [Thermoplasmata archaeon]